MERYGTAFKCIGIVCLLSTIIVIIKVKVKHIKIKSTDEFCEILSIICGILLIL